MELLKPIQAITLILHIGHILSRAGGCKVEKVGSRPTTSKANSDQGEAEDCQITDTSAPLCLLLLLIEVSFDNILYYKIILTLGGATRWVPLTSSFPSTSS